MSEKCQEVRELILRAVVEDLEPDLRARLQNHLSACAQCREEQSLCEATHRRLSTVEDVPVPRHFFVQPDAERIDAWQALRRLAFPWKLALASVLAAALLVGVLAFSDFRFRAENGVYAFSFGQPLPETVTHAKVEDQVRAVRAELERWVDQKLASERQQYLAALRAEIEKTDGRGLTSQQRTMLLAALSETENRLADRIQTAGTVLESRMASSVTSLYDTIQSQRAQDLRGIRQTISASAMQNEASDRQTQEVLSTLLEVAELRMGGQN